MIKEVMKYSKEKLVTEVTAHDFEHSLRVYKIATKISSKLDCNLELIQVAALTHDIIDKKVSSDINKSKQDLEEKLSTLGYDESFIQHVFHIIENMSYSSKKTPSTIEGKIVQDADRIDAIGAIAIARTFAYGGSMSRRIYGESDDSSSIHHFYEKLLLLKEKLNTDIAKDIAKSRHDFMEEYLKQFHKEWNLEDIGE